MAFLLLDIVLGFNASNDPVGDLRRSLIEAKELCRQRGGELTIVASVCGTLLDPQDKGLQIEMLKECGVHVCDSNSRATVFCHHLLNGR